MNVLSKNTVVAIHINRPLTSNEIHKYAVLLDETRRERIKNHMNISSFYSGLLIRYLLMKTEPAPSLPYHINYGYKGKPYVENASFSFNISHSGDFVIGVLSPCSSGIDIELIKNHNPKLAKRYFSHAEIEALNNETDSCAKNSLFYKIWTRKESLLKLEGCGLSVPLDSFCVLDDICSYNNRLRYFSSLNIHPGYKATLCTDAMFDNEIYILEDEEFLNIVK